MIEFAYDTLWVAVRAVSVFGFWSAAICGLWVVGCGLWVVGCGLWVVGCGRMATLYRVVVQLVKRYM